MVLNFLYLLLIVILLIFLLGMIFYTLSLFYSSIMGSPYVPTKKKDLDFILKEVSLKKGKLFMELGCGDGRVVRAAVMKYKVNGKGIDINPLIIVYARFLSRLQKLSCDFYVQNILEVNYKNADYIYVFLMPDLLKKLLPIFEKQIRKGVIIISHGFKLVGWESRLFKIISQRPFPTYFYKFLGKTN